MARFQPPKSRIKEAERELRRIARTVGGFVRTHIEGASVRDVPGLTKVLGDYSKSLKSWAEATAKRLIDSVIKSTRKDFMAAESKKIGRMLRVELQESAVGLVARELQRQQVELITSIPLQAAQRVQELAMEAVTSGARAEEIAEQLRRTEQVTESRAMLIARTEIAKANAAIVQARAQSVGISYYIWRTMKDGAVRDSHARLEGTVHRFDDPPEVEDGRRHNPGEFPNCRCFAEPVFPTKEGGE